MKQHRDDLLEGNKYKRNNKEQSWFTPNGGFQMAVVRNVSATAARSIGLARKVDAHHSTVLQWKLKAAAANTECSRPWYTTIQAWLGEGCEGLIHRFSIHCARGDKTNTTVPHHEALRTQHIISSYIEARSDMEHTKVTKDNWGGLHESQGMHCSCNSWSYVETIRSHWCQDMGAN